jgi:RNA polymerase sigma-70 factor, ECF subfamily
MIIHCDECPGSNRLTKPCKGSPEQNSGITDINVKHNGSLSSEVALSENTRGLFAYAMTLTRNPVEAEDLVQETYVRAIRAMDRLREESNIRAWLFTILRNLRLNQIRQQRARPPLLELDADENSAGLVMENAKDPHTLFVCSVAAKHLWEAIQQLSDESRTIILMREYRGLSYQEIAASLDCPPGTVMSRLARTRSKLGILLRTARHASKERGKSTESFPGVRGHHRRSGSELEGTTPHALMRRPDEE